MGEKLMFAFQTVSAERERSPLYYASHLDIFCMILGRGLTHDTSPGEVLPGGGVIN